LITAASGDYRQQKTASHWPTRPGLSMRCWTAGAPENNQNVCFNKSGVNARNGVMSSNNPDPAAVGRQDKLVVARLNRQIAYGNGGNGYL